MGQGWKQTHQDTLQSHNEISYGQLQCCVPGAVTPLSLSNKSRGHKIGSNLYPTTHLSHIPQCTIQNKNVHISVLGGVLWDMGLLLCGNSEISQLQFS